MFASSARPKQDNRRSSTESVWKKRVGVGNYTYYQRRCREISSSGKSRGVSHQRQLASLSRLAVYGTSTQRQSVSTKGGVEKYPHQGKVEVSQRQLHTVVNFQTSAVHVWYEHTLLRQYWPNPMQTIQTPPLPPLKGLQTMRLSNTTNKYSPNLGRRSSRSSSSGRKKGMNGEFSLLIILCPRSSPTLFHSVFH